MGRSSTISTYLVGCGRVLSYLAVAMLAHPRPVMLLDYHRRRMREAPPRSGGPG